MKKATQIKEITKVTASDRYVDLTGFKMQDDLNPKIWDKNQKLRPEIRKNLLKIADDYIESLEIEGLDIDDVTFTGSLANYNWSQYSDVDLHILVDYKDIPVDESLIQDFLKSKSTSWNQNHDIKIYGYDVELYAQDTEEVHYSSGVYSVMNDEWISKPKKFRNEVDKVVLTTKIKCWTDKIDSAVESESDEDDSKILDNLKDKLKKYRQSGLEKDGELSYENLVFKFLRRSGHIQKLFDTANNVIDKGLSVERKLED